LDQESCAKICRVIIAGNSLSQCTQTKDSETKVNNTLIQLNSKLFQVRYENVAFYHSISKDQKLHIGLISLLELISPNNSKVETGQIL